MANEFEGLYNQGAVSFNPLPYVQLAYQMQAKREAKQQALDEYYQDLSKNLTPAGMAANDVPEFTNKVNAWKDYVAANRNVLNNPRDKRYGEVASQAGYLYNDALQDTVLSKQKTADLNWLNQTRLSHPSYTITDAGIEAANNASLPLSNGYKPLNKSLIEYQPLQKPATVDDLMKYENVVKNGLQMSEGKPEVIIDPKTKTKVITTKSFYEPQAINTMARRSEILYQNDPKFKDLVDNLISNPNNYSTYNEAFKKVYGHDLDIHHPEEFATAVLLGQTEKTNTQPYQYSPPTIKINTGSLKEEAKTNNIGLSIDNYIEQLKANSVPQTYKYAGSNKSETHYQIQPNPELSDALAVGSGASKRLPDQIQFLPNGDVLPVFYKVITDKQGKSAYAMNGNNAAIDKSLTQPISANEFRIRIAKSLLGQTGVAAEMKLQAKSQTKQSSNKSYLINGKSFTLKQLNDLGYSQDQIQQAINLGNIKVK